MPDRCGRPGAPFRPDKILWYDSQGACLFTKGRERGRFIWPSAAGEAVTISPAQLSCMAAEGAIAAYEQVVGECWKPFDGPADNPGADRRPQGGRAADGGIPLSRRGRGFGLADFSSVCISGSTSGPTPIHIMTSVASGQGNTAPYRVSSARTLSNLKTAEAISLTLVSTRA